MNNFSAWWAFCQLPEHDGHAEDAAPGEPWATRWGFTYPTWCIARRHAGFRDISLATFNTQAQAQMGSLAQTFLWTRLYAHGMPAGVDVSVVDFAWTSGGAIFDIQRDLTVRPDGVLGPVTLNALGRVGQAYATRVRDLRVRYYEDLGLLVDEGDGSYGGEDPGLGLRADACLALAKGLRV